MNTVGSVPLKAHGVSIVSRPWNHVSGISSSVFMNFLAIRSRVDFQHKPERLSDMPEI